jgi:hypothetical protein
MSNWLGSYDEIGGASNPAGLPWWSAPATPPLAPSLSRPLIYLLFNLVTFNNF